LVIDRMNDVHYINANLINFKLLALQNYS